MAICVTDCLHGSARATGWPCRLTGSGGSVPPAALVSRPSGRLILSAPGDGLPPCGPERWEDRGGFGGVVMRQDEFRTELDALIRRSIREMDYRAICAEMLDAGARLFAGLPDADDRAAALEALGEQVADYVERIRPLRESLRQIDEIGRG